MKSQLMYNGVSISNETFMQVCHDLNIDYSKVVLTKEFCEICLLKQNYNNALKAYKP